MEKLVGTLNLLRFVNFGDFNFRKGYKNFCSELTDDSKVDWLSFHKVVFGPPVPLAIKL